MAVRTNNKGGTDWEDGEVLYADDLNDTFNVLSKPFFSENEPDVEEGVDGDVWYQYLD